MWKKIRATLAALRPGARSASHSSGSWGEQAAATALRRRGYSIIGRRIRVGRHDEIDIIARHRDVLVFVEVKTRANENFGRPANAVKAHKQHCLSRAAVRYMRRHPPAPDFFRFDIVEVIGTPGGPKPQIRHIENAFPLAKHYRI